LQPNTLKELVLEMQTAMSLRDIHGIDVRPARSRTRSGIRRLASNAATWVVNAVRTVAAEYVRRQRRRNAMQDLRRLDDRMLADIGLARSDIPRAARFGR
jgi:uncharacterized protein YjiS (DUF1127 family)